MRLIDADALYEKACGLVAQAHNYVGKLIERDGDEPSNEWKVWSAILTERTAFKHDVFDAPTVQPERKKGTWIRHPEQKNIYGGKCVECSECGEKYVVQYIEDEKFCRNCGADMRGTDE